MNYSTIFNSIRKGRTAKVISVFLGLSILNSTFAPTVALALTSGPSQPEVQSFTPVETTQMVDLFSGNFTYNIPLFEIPGANGGYPINLSYNSGIKMDQEASWVGLGWSLNPGAINRSVRGLPDDFNGDIVKQELEMKPDVTFGGSLGVDVEAFGASADKLKKTTGKMNFGLSTKISYNNYRGFGTGLGFSASSSSSFKIADKMTGVGFGLNLDSYSGSSVSISGDLSSSAERQDRTYTAGLTLNSKRGLGMMTSYGNTRYDINCKIVRTDGSASPSITFAERSFTPYMPYETEGLDLYASVTWGPGFCGGYADITVGGFYNIQKVKSKYKNVEAYGYMNLGEPFDLQKNESSQYILDYTREKDGVITDKSPNLAIPCLTYDTYSIQGQGIGGTFRPYRSDFGYVHDAYAHSWSNGFTLGGDIGGGHYGVALSYSRTDSKSKKWDENQLAKYVFTQKNAEIFDYEPYYFKVHGELDPMDPAEFASINGDNPIPIPVVHEGNTRDATLFGEVANPIPTKNDEDEYVVADISGEITKNRAKAKKSNERAPRATVVQPIFRKQLDFSSPRIVGEYKPKVYTQGKNYSDFTKPIDAPQYNEKSGVPGTHVSAYNTIDPSGKRYVYALPAYNNTKKEYLFSVNKQANNDQASVSLGEKTKKNYYTNITETPQYAYSYLLTSVLGADYVDADGDGPDDEDAGYWVKFNYERKNDQYGWRAPFKDANYDPGLRSFGNDDKGSYVEGTKEIWHVATIETNTHIAVFESSERADGRGIALTDGSNTTPSKSYKLNKIKLYTKAEIKRATTEGTVPVPLKTVHFDYDYSLCPHVDNGTDNGGKLTLKSLYFSYHGQDALGALNKYNFSYGQYSTRGKLASDMLTTPTEGIAVSNPDYDLYHVDRWGDYKRIEYAMEGNFLTKSILLDEDDDDYVANDTNLEDNDETDPLRSHPYTMQSLIIDGEVKSEQLLKQVKDEQASAWQLTNIQLPTGGAIQVQYESDDYAYVQHKPAAQMFRIESLGSGSDPAHKVKTDLYEYRNNTKGPCKITFPLENPVPSEMSDTATFSRMYLNGLKHDGEYQLYFKVLSTLVVGHEEWISGYADLSMEAGDYGFVKDGTKPCTMGYITLKPFEIKQKVKSRFAHPFAAAAWQYIRANKPQLLGSENVNESDLDKEGNDDRISLIKSYGDMFQSMVFMFSDYTNTASRNNYGGFIDLSQSMIRLSTPDGIKYGGGSRVRSVAMTDNWNYSTASKESSQVYGQVYEYTDTLNGKTISSGVATYEPLIGGDENALRYAKKYPQRIPYASDNNMFFEYPVNESVYPGESVGYSRVKVSTINSSNVLASANNKLGTTGSSVHTFYTCKEYPVMSNETDICTKTNFLPIYMPFIGMIEENKLTSGQGYSIELNDMHGKQKSVVNYAQKRDANDPEIISSTRYSYRNELVSYDGGTVHKLKNDVNVLVSEQPDLSLLDFTDEVGTQTRQAASQTKPMLMGVDYELFTDMRYSDIKANLLGLDFNIETFPIWVVPAPWPNINESFSTLRTAVSNKIVHRAGILDTVIQTKGAAELVTVNTVYDQATGRPLHTKTFDRYQQPHYSTANPAYMQYPALGSAAPQIGIENVVTNVIFSNSEADVTPININAPNAPNPDKLARIQVGDQLISQDGKSTAYVYGKTANKLRLYKGIGTPASTDTFSVISTAKQNVLTEDASGITRLINDPQTENYLDRTFSKYTVGYTWDAITAEKVRLGISTIVANFNEFIKIQPQTYPSRNSESIILQNTKNDIYNRLATMGVDVDLLAKLLERIDFNRIEDSNYKDFWSCEYVARADKKFIVDNQYFPEVCEISFVFRDDFMNSHSNFPTIVQGNTLKIYTPISLPRNCKDETFRILYGCTRYVSSETNVKYRRYFQNVFDIPSTSSSLFHKPFLGGAFLIVPKLTAISAAKVDFKYDIHYADLKYTNGGLSYPPNYNTIYSPNSNGYYTNGLSFFGDIVAESFPYIYYNGEYASKGCFRLNSPGTPPIFADFDETEFIFVIKNLTKLDNTSIKGLIGIDVNENEKLSYSVAVTIPSLSGIKETKKTLIHEYTTQTPNVLQASATEYCPSATSNYRSKWWPYKTYMYQDERYTSIGETGEQAPNLKTDGVYDGELNAAGTAQDLMFNNFVWNRTAEWPQADNWVVANTVTKRDDNGRPVETKDALGNYSAARYGYNDALPVIVAKNAQHNQIFFESFEEEFTYSSGKYSNSDGTYITSGANQLVKYNGYYDNTGTVLGTSYDNSHYIENYGMLLTPGYYVFSAWFVGPYNGSSGHIWIRTGNDDGEWEEVISEEPQLKKNYPWYLFTGRFWVKETTYLKFKVTTMSHIDNILIYPTDASVKAFVYDPMSMRLTAEVSEQNISTYYFYDIEGKLQQTKLENVGGNPTMREYRSHTAEPNK